MIELLIAFAAGLISFLSPCVLPLIPGYISYISGSSLNELVNQKNVNLIQTFLFTVGFSIVFVIFGAASTFLGQVLLQNSNELRIFAGIVIMWGSQDYIVPASGRSLRIPCSFLFWVLAVVFYAMAVVIEDDDENL